MPEITEPTFTVTEKAMRPASQDRKCFYCGEPVGAEHRYDCVLINKKVRLLMTIEFEAEVPNSWDKQQIEFHRNDGTYCADNDLRDLEELAEKEGCLCGRTTYQYLEDVSGAFLDE